MTRLRDIHGPGFTRDQYLSALATGYETGWWDDREIPAPWPDDIDDPTTGWQTGDDHTEPQQNRDEPAF